MDILKLNCKSAEPLPFSLPLFELGIAEGRRRKEVCLKYFNSI